MCVKGQRVRPDADYGAYPDHARPMLLNLQLVNGYWAYHTLRVTTTTSDASCLLLRSRRRSIVKAACQGPGYRLRESNKSAPDGLNEDLLDTVGRQVIDTCWSWTAESGARPSIT